ncbi:MAG: OmpW family protein [Gammaproteobacteria bacterium]
MTIKKAILSVCCGALLSSTVVAGGLFFDDRIAPDTELSPWQFRLRGISINPSVDSSTIDNIGGTVSHVSNEQVPELDISYFFNSNLSTELVLATARHDVEATRTTLGTVDLGRVSILPPTLTLVYHFFPHKLLSPYAGAGLNYTHFYNESSGPVAQDIKYKNSFGPALQAGLDINLNEHWSINFDVKKIFIESDVHVTTNPTTVSSVDVELNPYVYGIGIGYRV